MRGYFSSKISDNLSRSPENYLICHNVKLARTGWQVYSGEEWGDPSKAAVRVWRGPEEVFHPDAMESLKGKTVTYHHPPEWIGPHNEGAYSRGVTLDPRRGTEKDADGTEYLVGDLMIKDENLIASILAGLREVSLGYNFKPGRTADGHPSQTYIRFNHTAIVPKGRAGTNVAIRDHAGKEKKKHMTIQDIFARGVRETAKDESVSDSSFLASIGKFFKATDADEDEPKPKSKKKDDEEEEEAKDKKSAKDAKKGKDEEEPAVTANSGIESKLDKLIALLTPAAAEAEDEGLIETETLSGEEIPVNPIPGADKALDALMATKAAVAKSGDRKAIDGWNAAYKALKPAKIADGFSAVDAYKALSRQKPAQGAPASGGMQQATDAAKALADFETDVKKYSRGNFAAMAKV